MVLAKLVLLRVTVAFASPKGAVGAAYGSRGCPQARLEETARGALQTMTGIRFSMGRERGMAGSENRVLARRGEQQSRPSRFALLCST